MNVSVGVLWNVRRALVIDVAATGALSPARSPSVSLLFRCVAARLAAELGLADAVAGWALGTARVTYNIH